MNANNLDTPSFFKFIQTLYQISNDQNATEQVSKEQKEYLFQEANKISSYLKNHETSNQKINSIIKPFLNEFSKHMDPNQTEVSSPSFQITAYRDLEPSKTEVSNQKNSTWLSKNKEIYEAFHQIFDLVKKNINTIGSAQEGALKLLETIDHAYLKNHENLTIYAETEKFDVNLQLWAENSSVIKQMIFSEAKFKESETKEVSFHNLSSGIIKKLNNFLLTNESDINSDDFFDYVEAAIFLDMPKVLDVCKEIFKQNLSEMDLSSEKSIEDLINLHEVANKFGWKKEIEDCELSFNKLIFEAIENPSIKNTLISKLDYILNELDEKKIKLKTLNLSEMKNFNNEVLIKIFAKQPEITTLIIKDCENITNGLGIEKLVNIEYLDLGESYNLLDDIGPSLEKLPRLKYLNLCGCEKLTDAMGSSLGKLEKLEHINLSHNENYTDDIGPSLAKLPRLKYLNLCVCEKLTDALGSSLGKLEQLEHIDLSHNENYTDDIGPSLAKLPLLKYLNLSGCEKLTDALGSSLGKLEELEHIDLSNNENYTDNTIQAISNLTKLKHLNLENNLELTDAIGPTIGKFQHLEFLSLNGNPNFTHRLLQPLDKLLKLKDLNFFYNLHLTSAIGPFLEKFTSLKKLLLPNCPNLNDEIGTSLEKLIHLEELNLGGCPKITEAICPNIEKLTNLKHLNFNRCGFGGKIGSSIKKLSFLETLFLCNSNITDQTLLEMGKLPKLQYLNLMGCNELTDGAGSYFENFPLLTELNLKRCKNITDAIIPSLNKLNKTLIDAKGTSITKKGLEEIKRHNSNLENGL